ncbi:MAG: peptide chain release factor 1, partial [Candidatus Micrarchaeia archaeon]
MSERAKEFYKFKKQVEALKKMQGRGTQLVSVYVTPNYPLNEITAKLRDEAGQASNIKSSSTRKNVLAALEKIIQHLKLFKKPPENGMAVFAGNVSEREGK